MVDVIAMHCKRAMNGLNPHALPHETEVRCNKLKEENKSPSKDEKWNNKNVVLTS